MEHPCVQFTRGTYCKLAVAKFTPAIKLKNVIRCYCAACCVTEYAHAMHGCRLDRMSFFSDFCLPISAPKSLHRGVLR